MTPEPLKKEPTPHQQMMRAIDSRVGLPDPQAEGAAAKWLVEHKVSVEYVEMFLDDLINLIRKGEWKGRVSLQTAKKHIGTWMAKRGLRTQETQAVLRSEDSLTETEARELYDMLPPSFNYHRRLLQQLYRI